MKGGSRIRRRELSLICECIGLFAADIRNTPTPPPLQPPTNTRRKEEEKREREEIERTRDGDRKKEKGRVKEGGGNLN